MLSAHVDTKSTSTTPTTDFITVKHPGGRVTENQPTNLFINNEFVPSVSGKRFDTVCPNTGEVICSVAEAQVEDVNIAVRAAQTAFTNTWSKTPPAERSKLLYNLANLVEREAEKLAAIEACDNGKPFSQAMNVDLKQVVDHLRYFAGWADKIDGRVVDVNSELHAYTRAEPFGVVGQIVPWNFPLVMVAWKIAPALAAGNTLVLKTSEKTPLSALKLAQLVVEAGFPAGVVNFVSGFGEVAGEAITRHMGVRKVSFTGSVGVGRKVMRAAAESNLKKVGLELGGKSPNIVFNDADVPRAVESCVTGFDVNQGQVCCAGTRVFVQEDMYDEFLAQLVVATAAQRVGPSFEDDSNVGPLVDKIQFDRVMGYWEEGKKPGANVAFGG
ncbi:aldehyde dehydrogenase (NAD(P)(+)) ald5, partial [Podochytrium sp. JEL0797]